jgi:hypothetical protein
MEEDHCPDIEAQAFAGGGSVPFRLGYRMFARLHSGWKPIGSRLLWRPAARLSRCHIGLGA